MSDFLLELRSEEIPARMQAGARAELEKLFRKAMDDAGVALGALTVWSTPRRLALIARDLPLATAAVSEEVKGPRVGAPPQALEGFLRKTGLTEDQLVERDGVLFAVTNKPGRPTSEVLAEAIPAIVRGFSWPKSQRWGAASLSSESLRWVRPLSGIIALLGEDLVECEVGGIASGYATRGHRFHCPGEITIGSAADYQDKLRACHVIVDHEERQNLIREAARGAAAAEGLTLIEDEGLVIENAGLTESPVPLLGRFDETYLEVPPETIQLTARTNQKYFVCEKDGKLANAFVCTANITAADGGAAIVAGNRKVLAARLSDASFFWQQDRRKTLSQHAEGLKRITFHEKLGTVADKVERVAKLARWLVEEGIVKGANADEAEQAARLCKADLVTEMVGEFPELQGLMGGYYARAEGLSDAVADAIRDHYKPVGQGDEVPTAPVTVAVALADKLDTLVGFFAIGEKPTGSKDPYALRRAILGCIEIIVAGDIRSNFRDLAREAFRGFAVDLSDRRFVLWESFEDGPRWSRLLAEDAAYADGFGEFLILAGEPSMLQSEFDAGGKQVWNVDDLTQRGLRDFNARALIECVSDLTEFCFDRLRDREKRFGRRYDIVSAVMPRNVVDVLNGLGIGRELVKLHDLKTNDDVVRILALSEALQAFVGTEDGINLLAGYKRAANILKREEFEEGVSNPEPEPAEAALIAALNAAEPRAAAAIEAEDFTGAMAALATLRTGVDAFFETVTVNDADPVKRAARLGLLARFRAAVHKVADFSRIEG
ncbi:MAG: glycine--tRNA ligase subunit beta [Novosphingobium sp.]|mgnify:CR=1 FL=1|nr:glycine--tRNA ligase subunit beta [Novosphingobium sp.]